MSCRAVFLDRDGVLNGIVKRAGGPASPRSVAETVIEPGAAVAVARLRAAGFRTFVVSNQPDVARGLLAPGEHEAIQRTVTSATGVDDALACVHDDADGCDCRKPRPGLIVRLARAWDVDPHVSFMIGDRESDIAAGRAAGCLTVLLRRPYNRGSVADLVVSTLEEAVDRILAYPVSTSTEPRHPHAGSPGHEPAHGAADVSGHSAGGRI